MRVRDLPRQVVKVRENVSQTKAQHVQVAGDRRLDQTADRSRKLPDAGQPRLSMLSLLESFLHVRWKPVFEGGSESE